MFMTLEGNGIKHILLIFKLFFNDYFLSNGLSCFEQYLFYNYVYYIYNTYVDPRDITLEQNREH